MNNINLESITNENFEAIIKNIIGTDCTMDFSNYTEDHEQISLNLGLTIYTDSETLTVASEADDANNYY